MRPETIPIIRASDVQTFRLFEKNNRPVVFDGLPEAEDWAARNWNLELLSQRVGDEVVEVVHSPTPHLRWPDEGLPYEKISFEEFVRRMQGEPREGSRTYLQDDINNLPALASDVVVPSYAAGRTIQRTKLWVSGSGITVSLHYDPVDTLHWLVRGKKRFTCFPPGVRNFYPKSVRTTGPMVSTIDDAEAPDLARFPRFASETPHHVVLEAGQVLYLPTYWWHQVTSLDDLNISLNFIWFASARKNAIHFPSLARCLPHIARQLRRTRRAELTRGWRED